MEFSRLASAGLHYDREYVPVPAVVGVNSVRRGTHAVDGSREANTRHWFNVIIPTNRASDGGF